MAQRIRSIDDLAVPSFLYGTAWKEEDTTRLTALAIEQGFRGIDTANQRRHYNEAAVGEGIAACVSRGLVTRADLFLQTKFTFRRGQDHRLPYDPQAPIGMQVEQSFASSLEHLRTDRIDSYVLHGPTQRAGLAADDWNAWRAMEAIHDSGRVRWLGISNVSADQLALLVKETRIAPRFVQNRCYASQGWDRKVRDVCRAQRIVYQGFSLLTANRDVLVHPVLAAIAKRHARSASQIVFRFALDVGMIPLTGTTDPRHMQADLASFDFPLSPQEVQAIESIADN